MKVFRRSRTPDPAARARALARLAARPPTHADLTDAAPAGADLTDADPGRADLTGAGPAGADLTDADPAGVDLTRADFLHTQDIEPEAPEERDEVRGGWIPDQVPDRLRNARWTLTPRHVLVLLAVLAAGLTWATWSFLHARPTPIPETRPTTTTTGSPIAQPCTQSQPALGTTQSCANPSPAGASPPGPTQPGPNQPAPTAPGALQTQPGAIQPGPIQPGTGQTQPGSNQSPGTGGQANQQLVVVYVAGKVRHPGLVRAPTGSRVADVLTLAGGALRGVDLTNLNLARLVTDGEQIIVGQATQPAPTNPQPPATASTPPTAQNSPVNLNTATLEQLDGLPGVGPVLAQRILDYRTQNGPFTTIDQLQEVPGVGPKKFDSLKPHVTL